MKHPQPFEPGRILCPVDFSDLSSLALKYAAMGAREFSAGLTVLHAERFEVPRYFSRKDDSWILSELKKAETTVESQLRAHVATVLGPLVEGLSISYRVIDRHPVDAVLDTAEQGGFDLIIMGTHGHSGLQHLFLGSVAENVVRNAKIPVFTARQKAHQFIDVSHAGEALHLKRILCPCNDTVSAACALQAAVSMARRFKSRLTVIYSSEHQPDGAEEEVRRLCSEIGRSVQDACEIETVVRKGNAVKQILAQARENRDDLIIIGANHRLFMESTVFGRTTELVLRLATVPVMVVPYFTEK